MINFPGMVQEAMGHSLGMPCEIIVLRLDGAQVSTYLCWLSVNRNWLEFLRYGHLVLA